MKLSRIPLAFKALRELGPRQVGLFALYRAGLLTGYFQWQTGDHRPATEPPPVSRPILHLPDAAALREILGPEGIAQLKMDADLIAAGQFRIFGGSLVPINLSPPGELAHWTAYARGKSPFPASPSKDFPLPDIKFIWEPARFGWAFTLARAYHLTGDERYPAAFWRYFEAFSAANPVNRGPNWESAQEVALRLMAFAFAAQIFDASPHATAPRTSHLARSIAEHAARIPPTLIYARAQNNNHLLSEAAGLITAARALPEHPHAKRWAKLGWQWFTRGLETQIAADGTYMQQSTNYHRLMLQLALWVFAVRSAKCDAPRTPHPALASATEWLLNLCDSASGGVPNLGPNDGAYIFPLTHLPFSDYRPVLQAAAHTFLGEPAFAPGPWDEMSLWLPAASRKLPAASPKPQVSRSTLHAPRSWAYLRAAHFTDRPGHADQLHLDLWWRGLNVAQDAGTYRYNAAPPWDNALTHTAVHNTVTINHAEQMTRAGRFLYLDRAQAEIIARETAPDGSWERILAQHNGYRKLGIVHHRTVTAFSDDHWVIEDRMLARSTSHSPRSARLHWLLPDWPYEISLVACSLRLESPHGWITLMVGGNTGSKAQPATCNLQLARAGELIHGTGPISPTWGWVSPTYGVKIPALSFSVTAEADELPLTITSEWSFPGE